MKSSNMNIKTFQRILPLSRQMNIFDKQSDAILEHLIFCDGAKGFVDKKVEQEEDNYNDSNEDDRNNENGKVSCTTCNMWFDSSVLLREHCKLDWHRYNVKQKYFQKPTVTEDEFEEQISGELSSISGSDTEDDDGKENEDLEPRYKTNTWEQCEEENFEEKSLFNLHPTKKFYITSDLKLVSFYRGVLKEPPNPKEPFTAVKECKTSCIWSYLLLSGGHFAAALFNRDAVIEHKTFHRYTVRAKRGTIQGVQDKKNAGVAKSAGGQLRRYNEAALAEDIQKLLVSWSDELKKSDKIFYKCSSYHMNVFFNEKTTLRRDDSRIVKISMQCNRPTFKEVRRIHQLFTSIEIYGLYSTIENDIEQMAETIQEKPKPKTLTKQSDLSSAAASPKGTHVKKRDKNQVKSTSQEKKEKPARVLNVLEIKWNTLHKSILDGKTDILHSFLIHDETQSLEEDTEGKKLRLAFFLESYQNLCSQEYGETLLHAAAKLNDNNAVKLLLLSGADPCVLNKQGRTSYELATNKETRNEFRRFMATYPDKYDYQIAKIPSPLTAELEQEQQRKAAEKKKQQQKAKREKQKAKKAVERQEKRAEKENKNFDSLSDREKRAVMAERRFASQLTSSLKCSNCRNLLDETKAFDRFEYKYCSVDCVQAHKKTLLQED